MRDKAAGIDVGRVHLVGQNVVFAQVKVWLGFGMRHVAVRRVGVGATRLVPVPAAPVLVIETVHLAVGPGKAAGPVTGRDKIAKVVQDVPGRLEPDRLQGNLLPAGVVAVRLSFRAGKAVEQIVEAAILLNDDDDVLDLAARGMVLDPQQAFRGRRNRRNSAAVAGAKPERDSQHRHSGKRA